MKRRALHNVVVLASVLFLFRVSAGSAYEKDPQQKLPADETCVTCADGSGHDEVSRISLKELKEKMDAGAAIVIVDVRPRGMYDEGHIRGALSIPWAPDLKRTDLQRLPSDKVIVIYCDCGPGEADSADLAAKLREMGLVDVRVLADPSIRGWIKAGYPME